MHGAMLRRFTCQECQCVQCIMVSDPAQRRGTVPQGPQLRDNSAQGRVRRLFQRGFKHLRKAVDDLDGFSH